MRSRNLNSKLTVKQLANAGASDPRQFSRGVPRRRPVNRRPKAVRDLRVETARLMMEQSRHPNRRHRPADGFADRYRMRRAFLRAFGQPPQAIRRNARAEVARERQRWEQWPK